MLYVKFLSARGSSDFYMSGKVDIPDNCSPEKFVGKELLFTMVDSKLTILPYKIGDTGIMEFSVNERFNFKIVTRTSQSPFEGCLIILNRVIPRNKIFTIGYGNREINDFIELLKQFKIQFLVDIRSSPYAKYNCMFSQIPLEEKLLKSGIRYVFMGDTLGGRPKDQTCYTSGKVDYEKVERQDFFQKGITRLEKALELQLNVVLMCSELKPEECHRCKLIGQTLKKKNIDIVHIDEKGVPRSQQEIIYRINHGQITMFEQTFTSKKAYQ